MSNDPAAAFLRLFHRSVDEVTHALVRTVAAKELNAARDEALLLLCRLLFLAFVEAEGWLAGERRFLRDRFRDAESNHREFFSSVLLPLFFGCLNVPVAERGREARALGAIPYLNGGLFEPSRFEQLHPDLHLPNDLLRRVLIDTFGGFEFRITPETGSAAIDPDMLGRVFETVMPDVERAASGSYYTPRELADALTTAAIDSWLGPAPTEARLAKILILDPACGSGAILLSALRVLTQRWRSVTGRADVSRIVASSLYGVDIKPEAVRICELRLWLAVAAEANSSSRDLTPLPNLDRNILQGNSLFSPTDFLGDARRDVYAEWLGGLRRQRMLLRRYHAAAHSERPALYGALCDGDQQLAGELLRRTIADLDAEVARLSASTRDLFGRAVTNLEGCRTLYRRAGELRAMLARVEAGAANFFSYDVHFAPVLASGGFDVVVGNPPWIRSAHVPASERRMLADRFPLFRGARAYGDAPTQGELSIAFFERSLRIVARDGVVAMLMPARIATTHYAAPLRRALSSRLVSVTDCSAHRAGRSWFDADVEALAVIARSSVASTGSHLPAPEPPPTISADFGIIGRSAAWTHAPREVLTILQRLLATQLPLEDALQRPMMGVKTGQNRLFFLTGGRICGAHLVTVEGVPIPLAAVCRAVRGRDVRRWQITGAEWMLWFPELHDGPWLAQFATARGVDPRALRLTYASAAHLGLRVAWKDISRGFSAVVMEADVRVSGRVFPLVPNQTVYFLPARSYDEAHAAAAVLNSTVAGALLLATAERMKDAHYRYFARNVASLPWPDIRRLQPKLARLSGAAHRGRNVDSEIDDLVARAYGVAPDEQEQLQLYVQEKLR